MQLPGLTKDVDLTANVLLISAAAAERRGDGNRAALLLGASDAAREEAGVDFEPVEKELHHTTVSALVANIGTAALDAGLAEGRKLGLEDTIRLFGEVSPP